MTQAKTKHKYSVGEEVLVRFKITALRVDGAGDEEGYAAHLIASGDDDNAPWVIPESWIDQTVPMVEPKLCGTVVVVDNNAYTQLSGSYDDSTWVSVTVDAEKGFTWVELLVLGNPKIIWEPES